jgi:hypothetical protein
MKNSGANTFCQSSASACTPKANEPLRGSRLLGPQRRRESEHPRTAAMAGSGHFIHSFVFDGLDRPFAAPPSPIEYRYDLPFWLIQPRVE